MTKKRYAAHVEITAGGKSGDCEVTIETAADASEDLAIAIIKHYADRIREELTDLSGAVERLAVGSELEDVTDDHDVGTGMAQLADDGLGTFQLDDPVWDAPDLAGAPDWSGIDISDVERV